MNMANKKVKKDYFMELKEIKEVRDNPELMMFIDHELELLARKNTGNTQTKTQKENIAVAEMLLKELAKAGKTTITDLMNTSDIVKNYTYETKIDGEIKKVKLTNQKISAIFKQQLDAGKITKTVDKKKSYFAIAEIAE
jgi:hypothetical protein